MNGWKGQQKTRAFWSRRMPDTGCSVITITGYFRDDVVPEYVVDSTIAHELVHYAHGFHSPHPQLYEHPHKGGIVDKELVKRGMGETLAKQQHWLKHEWLAIVGQRTVRRKRKSNVRMRFLRLISPR
jgi:hypothetical protein